MAGDRGLRPARPTRFISNRRPGFYLTGFATNSEHWPMLRSLCSVASHFEEVIITFWQWHHSKRTEVQLCVPEGFLKSLRSKSCVATHWLGVPGSIPKHPLSCFHVDKGLGLLELSLSQPKDLCVWSALRFPPKESLCINYKWLWEPCQPSLSWIAALLLNTGKRIT